MRCRHEDNDETSFRHCDRTDAASGPRDELFYVGHHVFSPGGRVVGVFGYGAILNILQLVRDPLLRERYCVIQQLLKVCTVLKVGVPGIAERFEVGIFFRFALHFPQVDRLRRPYVAKCAAKFFLRRVCRDVLLLI